MQKTVIFAVASVLGVVALLGSGCATAMSSSEYNVNVQSEKPGVTFKVYNRKNQFVHQGTTPEYVTLPAQSEHFTKEIYTFRSAAGKSRKITATISPFYWGNAINLVGFGFDGITGAMWALPKGINLDKPQGQDIISQNMNL